MAGDEVPDLPIVVSALGLDERGKRLFNSMRKQYPNMDPVQLELLVEACRIADQLEKLHSIIHGDVAAWAFVRLPRNAGELILQIDQMVDKQRQLQLALKSITATLTVAGEAAPAQTTGGVNDIAERARRRAEESGRPLTRQPGTAHPVRP